MRAKEFINEIRPSSAFINDIVDKKVWTNVGKGCDVSVWHNPSEPDTIVKITGGGFTSGPDAGVGQIEFANFCLNNAKHNPHYPKVLAINNDDPDICQIKMERLVSLPNYDLGDMLLDLANSMDGYMKQDEIEYLHQYIFKELRRLYMHRQNDIEDIIGALKFLDLNKPADLTTDLHPNNWMMRPNGTIVISDPWIA